MTLRSRDSRDFDAFRFCLFILIDRFGIIVLEEEVSDATPRISAGNESTAENHDSVRS